MVAGDQIRESLAYILTKYGLAQSHFQCAVSRYELQTKEQNRQNHPFLNMMSCQPEESHTTTKPRDQ